MPQIPAPSTYSQGNLNLDPEELAAAFMGAELVQKYWADKIIGIEAAKFEGWRAKAALARAQCDAARSLRNKLSTHWQFQLPPHEWFGAPIEKARAAEEPPTPAPTRKEREAAELDRFFAKVANLGSPEDHGERVTDQDSSGIGPGRSHRSRKHFSTTAARGPT